MSIDIAIPVIHNKQSTIQVLEGNIMHVIYHKNATLEVVDIKEVETSYYSLPDPKPMLVLSELEDYVNMSAEARIYAAEHSPDLNAIAYVIQGLSQRLLVRFYIRLRKRDKPTQVYEHFDEALAWLKSVECIP